MTRTREQSKPSIRAALAAAAIAAIAAVAVLAGPSASAGAACPNEAFRTGASAALPDCRAYEMVSPAAKNGYDVDLAGARAAADDSGISFRVNGALPESESAPYFGFYLSRRGVGGWGTDRVSPPVSPFSDLVQVPFLDWNADLTRAVVLGAPNSPLTPDSSSHRRNLYVRDNLSGSYSLAGPGLFRATEFGDEPTGDGIYGAASADLSSVAFVSEGALVAGAPAVGPSVYASTPTGPSLVSILPGGEAAPEGAVLGSLTSDRNAVSDDGSRIVFTTLPELTSQVFVRIGDTGTAEASASQRGTPDPLGRRPAEFKTASGDGSLVFFTSSEQLTDDADTGAGDDGRDLYRYDVDSKGLIDLSAGSTGTPNGAEVQGVVGASDDGKVVYFVALGQLDGNAGVAGSPNLYVWHDNAAHFVATLSTSVLDGTNWSAETSREALNIPSRVSADGSEAVIVTDSPQPGFDNVDPVSGKPHSEVYRFSLGSQPGWTCVSCGSDAGAATGNATTLSPPLQVFGPVAEYLNRALAGGAVIFNSDERLTGADLNDVSDVYRWRAGQLDLISSGAKGSLGSYFADASSDGDDVFILTHDRLFAGDTDDLGDVYDARVDGGFAAPLPAPALCGGAQCRGPGSAPAPQSAVATPEFAGPGNPKPRRHRHHHRKQHGHRHHKGEK